MPATSLNRIHVPRALLSDLPVIASLVGLDVAARLLPHAPDFTPVAATALFAASVLRIRALSVLVPIVGLVLGDVMLGFYDIRVMAFVYGTLALPACAAWMSRRLRRPGMIVPILLSSSLTFFFVTNFAVWAFSTMYAPNWTALVECYVAALPFLQNMAAGDLFWGLVLFGTYWLVQNMRAAKEAVPHAVALRA
ncbi:MAG TPA: DUF6580 family putative transport protein [Xanthobacteraceae bacterium]|nr:DUF6580 family putative transport protein [Xanthobacteraceae bacterium]